MKNRVSGDFDPNHNSRTLRAAREAMMPVIGSIIAMLLALFSVVSVDARAQHGEHVTASVSAKQLGEVSFSVSCSGAAQEEFNRAMAMFHSFWFDPAKSAFAKVLNIDPECGMAHWGIAMMSMGNPFAWPPNANALEAGEAAMFEARRVGAKSDREQDYIAALATYFENRDTTEHRARAVAFEKAMGALSARYPVDDEAKILHALLLDATALPTDKTFSNQLRAAAILEPLFEKYPNHPGIAHYLIHTFDYAELAEKGLSAARAYAKIAPAVPHALHMPSHIFSRVGLWSEMVDSNRASYLAARGELEQTTFEVGTYDALHAIDYMVFAHLQQGQDKAAKALVDQVAGIRKVNVENIVAAYAFAAIPARYALERGDWVQAAALELSPPELDWRRYPQAEAIVVFARGLGAARIGDVATAQQSVERLQELKEAMLAANSVYWAGQTDIQIKATSAWVALAQNRRDDALRLMRAAADAEDASDKHPVTPGNVAPSRELLGELLMELGLPAQAVTEFERSLKRDPNRLRSVFGAAHASEASDDQQARGHYCGKLRVLTAHRDTERMECAVVLGGSDARILETAARRMGAGADPGPSGVSARYED